MSSPADLPNLGPKSAAWLAEVGIGTEDELFEAGPVEAYLRVSERYPQASLNLLWALFGAVTGCDWREVPPAEKDRLRAEVERGRRPTRQGS